MGFYLLGAIVVFIIVLYLGYMNKEDIDNSILISLAYALGSWASLAFIILITIYTIIKNLFNKD